MRFFIVLVSTVISLSIAATAQAFCGFYVAKADTELFNEASQVVLVRDGKRTVITMVNDFKGDVSEFAMVVPVPTFIEREQINVGEQGVVDHLDAYTAPRLVEYFDEDPCRQVYKREMAMSAGPPAGVAEDSSRPQSLGVTIEASYTVGEYDILILSAEDSGGLITWLNENEYRLPAGAERVVGSYIKQGMRFFIARVNLEEQAKSGRSFLRPLQVAFESEKFMLPIRLGTLNAKGKQDMYVYTLTRSGRVETSNYRTVRIPSNVDIPVHVKNEFGHFYKSMFARQTALADDRGVFLEYAWDMGWCDPCAADPLSPQELRSLGVFWLDQPSNNPRASIRLGPQDVFVTRLHVRYDAEHFPEDLMLTETGDRTNFQGRYVLRHPFAGESSCSDSVMAAYKERVLTRQEQEARTLANLTGWNIEEIRLKIPELAERDQPKPWWHSLWNSAESLSANDSDS